MIYFKYRDIGHTYAEWKSYLRMATAVRDDAQHAAKRLHALAITPRIVGFLMQKDGKTGRFDRTGRHDQSAQRWTALRHHAFVTHFPGDHD